MSSDWGVEYTVVYNGLPAYIEKLKLATDLGLDSWAAEVELEATADTVVKTGALRASRFRITPIVDEFDESVAQALSNNPKATTIEKPIIKRHAAAAVGFSVSYARYVEEGHHTSGGSFIAGRPFLRPALERHLRGNDIASHIKRKLGGLF